MIPFHKQTDPKKQAGQVVTQVSEQYLHQYIARKTECCGNPLRGCKDCPPPTSFESWYSQNPPGRFWNTGEFEAYLKQVWNAGRETNHVV